MSGLKESDAYPLIQKMVMMEKFFSERMCRHFRRLWFRCKVTRYHNIFGPNGTYDGGREKAPAQCRKIIEQF